MVHFNMEQSREHNLTQNMSCEELAVYNTTKEVQRRATYEAMHGVCIQRYNTKHGLCVTVTFKDGVLYACLEASADNPFVDGRKELLGELLHHLSMLGDYDWRTGWSKDATIAEAQAFMNWVRVHPELESIEPQLRVQSQLKPSQLTPK